MRFLAELGLDAGLGRRPFCRPCLDWSERRPHLAGRHGAALCRHSLEAGWVWRRSGSRAQEVKPPCWRAFREVLGVDMRA